MDIANLRNSPIEIVENVSGVRILKYALRPDSGGPGKHRGGLGIIFEFEVLEHDCLVTARGQERHRFRPWGLFGGQCGEKAAVFIKRAGAAEFEPLRKIDSLQVDCGDVLRILTPGGGGYGSPFERDPTLVLDDVQNSLISAQAARDMYGVILAKGGVATDATEKLRQEIRPTEEPKMYCFGPERDAYEAIWTDAAWARLIDHVFSLPVPLRASMRGRLWTAAQQLGDERGGALTPEDIDRCWKESIPAGIAERHPANTTARQLADVPKVS